MKLKGLLGRGDQDADGEEEKTYFMQELEIDDSEWGKTSSNQTIRQKIVQFCSKPSIAFTMDLISTILNLATVVWYVVYLDRIHHFTDGDNN